MDDAGICLPQKQNLLFQLHSTHRKYQSWMIRLLQNSVQGTLSETGLSQHKKRGRKLKDWQSINGRLGVWPAELLCVQWLVWNTAVLISPICFGTFHWFEKSPSKLWQHGHRKLSKFPGNKHIENCCLFLGFHNFSCCFSLLSHVAWWPKQTSLDSFVKKDGKKKVTLWGHVYIWQRISVFSRHVCVCLPFFALWLVGSF